MYVAIDTRLARIFLILMRRCLYQELCFFDSLMFSDIHWMMSRREEDSVELDLHTPNITPTD